MDNVDCGGMAARIDVESGKLKTVGADKQGNTFMRHPMTDAPIVGFTIPFWKEAKGNRANIYRRKQFSVTCNPTVCCSLS